MVRRRWPQISSGIPCFRGFPTERGWSSSRTGSGIAAARPLSRLLKASCALQTKFGVKFQRMARTDAVEVTEQKFDLPYGSLVTGLGALVVILFGASLAIGYLPVDLWQGVSDLWKGEWTPPALVLVELRVPRALLGSLVGFSLGLTGAAMQGLLRNPLAEPGIIGVSSTAALGAVVVFYFGLSGVFVLA